MKKKVALTLMVGVSLYLTIGLGWTIFVTIAGSILWVGWQFLKAYGEGYAMANEMLGGMITGSSTPPNHAATQPNEKEEKQTIIIEGEYEEI